MKYQRCTRCIMDNANDPFIKFDSNGHCNYCQEATNNMPSVYFPNNEGKDKLKKLIIQLKKEGQNNEYDCMMGISGGLDSSYLAYLGSQWGLRILAIHIDDGFDTQIAKDNIKKLCYACKIKLITITPNHEQYNDLIRAFFRAEVINIAFPQDNALLAILYKYAKKYRIKTFLSGGNFALECILRRGDSCNAYDTTHIKDIHKKFGESSINNIVLLSNYQRVINRYIYRINSVRPLNFIDYNKERAIRELYKFCDFSYYEQKHCENLLTKVIQLYWMVEKFNSDKRTSHLSSMIISGQMTRDEALQELEKPVYDKLRMDEAINFVVKKLNISRSEFDLLVDRPGKRHSDYKTSWIYRYVRRYIGKFVVKFKG